MNSDLLVITITLSLAVIFFVTGWIRRDLVAVLVVLVCMVTGVLTIDQSLAGFSDPVVIITIAMRMADFVRSQINCSQLIIKKVNLNGKTQNYNFFT